MSVSEQLHQPQINGKGYGNLLHMKNNYYIKTITVWLLLDFKAFFLVMLLYDFKTSLNTTFYGLDDFLWRSLREEKNLNRLAMQVRSFCLCKCH